MTKITIEIDGSAEMKNMSHAPQGDQPVDPASQSSGATDAGSAPAINASQVGPIAHFSSTESPALNPAFDPEGAVSAGPAPAHLMGGVE